MNIFEQGTKVSINNGFGNFAYGVVQSYDATAKGNVLGNKGNYTVQLTHGIDCFDRAVEPGLVIVAHESIVSAV